jgi:beta-glucosidase-like glycosyl hydrolase
MMADSNTLLLPHNMPLRDKLAQLIFVRIGSNLPPIRTVEEDEERTLWLLAECPVGGLLLFNGGFDTKASLERLQRATQVPLLIAADIERGVGQQVKGHTLFSHAMAFDRLGDRAAAAVAEFAQVSAREARGVGIHISFSPVADVNTNPKNPIIATRAFSAVPSRASELAAAYVAAGEAAGLRTCAKHFPGHGDTHQDSHDSLPSVPKTLDELRACELLPFQAAIAAGCSLVMTAHVAFPALDPRGLPATLSQPILQGLLRDELGFRGAICSDSLLMAGVCDRFANEGEMLRTAIEAGVDLLLDVKEPVTAVDYLCLCVERGTLSRERVDKAFEQVWALKQRSFAGMPGVVVPRREQSAAVAERVARGAIEFVDGGAGGRLPLDPNKPLAAILLKPFELPSDPPEQPLAEALRSRFRDVRYLQIGPRADADQIAAAEELARECPQLLLAMIVKPAAWHAFGLLPAQRELVERLAKARDAVLVSLGVPYALADYPDAKVRICTYSDVPVSQRAVVDFLIGQAFDPTKWSACAID